MSDLLGKIFRNRSTRILVLLFASLLILIGYFLTHSYFTQLNIHKSKILGRLEAVAKTAALQLDGNQLEYVLETYQKKDAIKTNGQDKVYQFLHRKLVEIKVSNELSSPLYTLTYDSTNGAFFFGVSSSSEPFFRHVYDHFPEELMGRYKMGGRINVYEDKNGYWLSAFAPIRNSAGKTIAVVQADQRFDEFLKSARKEIFFNIGISLVFTIILIFFLTRSMQTILANEDRLTANLMQSKLEIEQKNQETLDSIMYAKKIQEAILPMISEVHQAFEDSFIFYLPRDIVSGDFYWFKEIGDKKYIAAVDCTGHGVPGAFMSMIGSVLLDDIVSKKGIEEPHQILNQLNEGVIKALKQNNLESGSRDGMDIALCVLDETKNKLYFAGALRPLIHIRDGVIERIKSDSFPIGGSNNPDEGYGFHEINIEKGDVFYLYSDGYPDQFGGEKDKKYMTKSFRDYLVRISKQPMSEQKELLETEFHRWRGDFEQVDDVLVIGFRV